MAELCSECGRSRGDEHNSATWVCDAVFGDGLCAQLTVARLRRELAEARAIGLTPVQAATITDGIRYPDNGALHCRWCTAGPQEPHESRCWYMEQVARADKARALVDELVGQSRGARAAAGEKEADRG